MSEKEIKEITPEQLLEEIAKENEEGHKNDLAQDEGEKPLEAVKEDK